MDNNLPPTEEEINARMGIARTSEGKPIIIIDRIPASVWISPDADFTPYIGKNHGSSANPK